MVAINPAILDFSYHFYTVILNLHTSEKLMDKNKGILFNTLK